MGQAKVECSECNHAIHHKFYKSVNTDSCGNFLCNTCVNLVVDILDEEIDLDDTTTKLSAVLRSMRGT